MPERSHVQLDPGSIAFIDDPYPFYQRLREADPVHWDESTRQWMLTRYADVSAGLHDARLAKAGAETVLYGVSGEARAELEPLAHLLEKQLDMLNPPHHTRLRSLVHRAFTPQWVESLRAYVQQLADELIDAVAATGQMDLMRDLAYPLPALVIMHMLGIPAEEREQLKRWNDDYAVLKGHGAFGADPVGAARQASASMQAFTEYLRTVAAGRRQAPGHDIISAFLAVQDQGDTLSEEELIDTCRMLLIAGSETTTNLIGNGTLALLQHPDQLAALGDDPSLTGSAVEELLRYDSSSQMIFRCAAEDLPIGDRTIEKGQMVALVLGAANRDPAAFPDPDRLDLAREPNHHLALGWGPHYCLGGPLVRLEADVVFSTILRRLRGLRLDDELPRRQPNPVWRGLQSLPLRFMASG
jgi:cytochrome P450